jgi:hypothetical protein
MGVPMSAPINLVGQRFGRWVVLRRGANDAHGRERWECVCGCPDGSTRLVSGYFLKNGSSLNGHYEPGNVKWSTEKEQQNNRRSNRLVTAWGRTHTLAQWAQETGVKYTTVHNRLKAGWTIETALRTPLYARGSVSAAPGGCAK